MGVNDKTIFDDSQSEILERNDYIAKIREELCVNETDTEQDIMRNINIAYKQALEYLEKDLFYNKTSFGKAGSFTFQSFDDIIYFLDETRTQSGKMYCRLVKLTISFYNTNPNFNSTIADVIAKTQSVIQNKMMPGLQIREQNEEGFSGLLTLENEPGSYKVIPFRFLSRVKSQKSTVSKEVRDPKYFLLESLSDIYGGKFLLKNREDILPFSQYIAGIVFKRGIFDIKDRSMFTDEEIEKSRQVNEEFRKKCRERKKDRKKISSENMRDWRIVSPYKKDDETKNMSLEIGFGLEGGENDTGLTSQYIYAFLRKIDEIIRLDQYIFPDHIKRIIEGCIYGLEYSQKEIIFRELRDSYGLIGKKIRLRNNNHARANIDTYLIPALYEYFMMKSDIIEIREKQWKKGRVAYSNERQIQIHNLNKSSQES